MEKLENEKKYKELEINGIIFSNVQVYIWKTKIELIDSWGRVTAQVYKEDIKTVKI